VISPPIDCTAQDQVFLKFRRWLNVESRKSADGGDHARIYVSTDGVNWGDPVWENPGYDFTDDQWTEAVIEITEIAADKPTVYIKFTMGPTNSTRPFSGWNIDDLEVTSESIYPVEGTIGTSVHIPGKGFGVKKGKVLIGTAALKVGTWADAAILGTISKVLPPDVYDFIIQPKVGSPIIQDAFFSMKPPEIDTIVPSSGSNPDEVTITGKYFGTKKGKILLGYMTGGEPKSKSCKVTYWGMDPVTGESTVKFIVPAKLPTGPCDLTITNKVGSYTEEDGFAITPGYVYHGSDYGGLHGDRGLFDDHAYDRCNASGCGSKRREQQCCQRAHSVGEDFLPIAVP